MIIKLSSFTVMLFYYSINFLLICPGSYFMLSQMCHIGVINSFIRDIH